MDFLCSAEGGLRDIFRPGGLQTRSCKFFAHKRAFARLPLALRCSQEDPSQGGPIRGVPKTVTGGLRDAITGDSHAQSAVRGSRWLAKASEDIERTKACPRGRPRGQAWRLARPKVGSGAHWAHSWALPSLSALPRCSRARLSRARPLRPCSEGLGKGLSEGLLREPL